MIALICQGIYFTIIIIIIITSDTGKSNNKKIIKIIFNWSKLDVKLTINPFILFQAWSMPENV